MLNICRAGLVDASTSIASKGRCLGATDTLSASVTSRRSGGSWRACARKLEYILGRVLVAVVVLTTLYAIELTHVQRHGFVDVATSRASLTAREGTINDAKLSTIPRALVGEHPTELSETRTGDIFGKAVIAQHAKYVQIFDSQHIETANEFSSEFVETIFSTVGNVRMVPSDSYSLTLPSTAIFHSPVQHALQPGEFHGMSCRVSRIGDALSIRERGQPRDSQVDPDLHPGFMELRLVRFIQTKSHEVTTSTVLCYRNCARFTCDLAAPFDGEATDSGNRKVAISGIPPEAVGSVFCALLPALRSESRIFRSLGEEVRERCLQMPQCLLLRHGGAFEQESEGWVIAMLRPRPATFRIVDRLTSGEAVRA